MAEQPTHLRFEFPAPADHAVVELHWDAAPRTCAALIASLPDGVAVSSCHARHSGAEALFLTPETIRDVGDENTTTDYILGDMLFGYEPKGICQHASEDASEVAWIYGGAAMARRWVSDDGDPTNQRGPWHTVDVPLNKWGTVVAQQGFYDRCGRMPRTGEQSLVITRCGADGVSLSRAAGSAPEAPVLLHIPRFCSSIVVAAIAEADLAVAVRVVGYPDELKSDALRYQTGGLHRVPALSGVSDGPLLESAAILEHLLETSGNTLLRVAPGAPGRGKYLSLVSFSAATVKPLVSNQILMAGMAPEPDTVIESAKTEWMEQVAPYLATQLGGEEYFVGGRLTAVDLALAKPLGNASAAGYTIL